MNKVQLYNNQDFEMQECVSCGCVFYIPHILGQQLRRTLGSFCCPSGHRQSYTISEADRLKSQLDTCKQQLQDAKDKITQLQSSAPVIKRRALRINK